MDTKKVQLKVEIDTHKDLKEKAAKCGISLRKLISLILEEARNKEWDVQLKKKSA